MKKTYDFLKECIPFWVATVNGECAACRPFGGVMEYQGKIYIPSGNKKSVYNQIKNNPNIQITAIRQGTRDWIRVTAKAMEATSPEEKQAMFDACPVLYKRYSSPDDENFALFKLENVNSVLNTEQGQIALTD
ncbi:MAG: pyridoxamine 5'-phosphate oxidase family protein [Oscillospiraceae bacterium]|nr:pyridoxamine 5'-phosphate oxidase family protein [Oscillospiraceae bacterium]